ncbi:MAG: ribosome maturation factor RimM [Bacteroidales bacterium]
MLLPAKRSQKKSNIIIETGILPVKRDELIPLGTIVRTHGYDGTVVIKTGRDYGQETEEMESVFVEVDGIPVPFILAGCEAARQSLFVSFLGYETRESVVEFTGCRVLTHGDVRDEDDKTLPLYLRGFSIISSDGTDIGVISGIESYPMQIMLLVKSNKGGELMIPLHPDWVVDIDREGEKIIMDMPDGLDTVNS